MKNSLSITLVICGTLILVTPIMLHPFMNIELAEVVSKAKDASVIDSRRYTQIDSYRNICACTAIAMILFGTLGTFIPRSSAKKQSQCIEAEVMAED